MGAEGQADTLTGLLAQIECTVEAFQECLHGLGELAVKAM